MASRSTLHRQGYRRRCSPTRRFQANPDSWFWHAVGLNNASQKALTASFDVRRDRPPSGKERGSPTSIFRRMGTSGLTVPQPALRRRKGRWMAFRPPLLPKPRDLVRLPWLLTPPLPLQSPRSPVREEASGPPSPPLSLAHYQFNLDQQSRHLRWALASLAHPQNRSPHPPATGLGSCIPSDSCVPAQHREDTDEKLFGCGMQPSTLSLLWLSHYLRRR